MENYPRVSSIQNTRKEGIQDLRHKEILPSQFCWCIVGSPGSGKTSFIQQLLQDEDLYKDKFDYILVISPSAIPIQNIDAECVTQIFSVQWIYDKLNYLKSSIQGNKNILIIIDDCVSELRKNQNDVQLQELLCNRRNIIEGSTISIILTSQQLMMLPNKFRSLCDPYTFLSVSPRDLDQIKRELVYSYNHKHLLSMLNTMQNERHSFIYIRQRPSLMCVNFRPVVQGSQYISQSNSFESLQSNKQSRKEQLLQRQLSRSRSRSPSSRDPPSTSFVYLSFYQLKIFEWVCILAVKYVNIIKINMQWIVFIHFNSLRILLSGEFLSVIDIVYLSFLTEFYNFLSRTIISFCPFLFRIQISHQYLVFMFTFGRSHPHEICYLESLQSKFFSQFSLDYMLIYNRLLILAQLLCLLFNIKIELSFLFIHFQRLIQNVLMINDLQKYCCGECNITCIYRLQMYE